MILFLKIYIHIGERNQNVFEGVASLIQCLIQVLFLQKMLVWGIGHLRESRREAETLDTQERRWQY